MLKGIRRRSVLLIGATALTCAAFGATQAQASLVAPGSACSGQKNANAPEPRQEDAMRCLIDYARDHSGVRDLDSNRKLEKAAGRKRKDVVECGFSHTACGRQADLWPHKFGYTSGVGSWSLGENLAWGRGKRGTARMILKAWLDSPPHRSTMLAGSFEDVGIGLYRGSFSGGRNAGVWVLQVGCRGC
jgi:uncharacterized protein YkwD